jgi:hypothetical protein
MLGKRVGDNAIFKMTSGSQNVHVSIIHKLVLVMITVQYLFFLNYTSKNKLTLINIGELEWVCSSIWSHICIGYTAVSGFLVNTDGIVQVVLKLCLAG